MQRCQCGIASGVVCFGLATLGIVAVLHGDVAQEGVADKSNWRLRTANEAAERARALVGWDGAAGPTVDTSLVTLAQDNTPYLNKQLVGRPLWHVVLRDWSFKLKSIPAGHKDPYKRIADIYLDPVDERILKLRTRWREGEREMPPEVSAEVGAAQMHEWGRKRYHGFPAEDPKITFLDALDSIRQGGEDPLAARQIVARYVTWSRMGREPKPVWAVMLRGVPVIAPLPGMPEDALTQYTYIVDARTGQFLILTNVPHPEQPGHIQPQSVEAQDRTR